MLETIVSGITPVDLDVGPDGRLYYVDIVAGTANRIDFFGGNSPPVARATATPDAGPLPLEVAFDGSGTTDDQPTSELTYQWDLDGDGAYDDASGATASYIYLEAGTVTVGLLVTDAEEASDTTTVAVHPGNSPPTATILAPSATDQWSSGEDIFFSGGGSDAEDGQLNPSDMRWTITLLHCQAPTSCHAHPQADRNGVSSDTFTAPQHTFPAYLEFRLTVTDSGGLTDSVTVRIDPRTVDLTFETIPPGLELLAGPQQGPTPLTVTSIVNSPVSITAPGPQTVGGVTYDFSSWSDGGPASHDVLAGTTNETYTAVFEARPATPSALLVVGNGGSPIAGDRAIRDRLVASGYSVTVVDDGVAQASAATGKDLVLISSSVTASALNTTFRDTTVPIISWEHALFDDLGMTASPGTLRSSQRNLVITSPGHPLAAGLSGTVQVATTTGNFGSGVPGANAVVVATVPGTTAAGIFAYEAGVTMPGRAAPARRVGLFMADATPTKLTAMGKSLFDAAVLWADG
jgi:PKD repeat protein